MNTNYKDETTQHSAGVLVYRITEKGIEVILGHCGGPKWKNKNVGAWNIPKGHVNQGESDLSCALREFNEETGLGLELPETSDGVIDLGESSTSTGKTVRIFAIKKNFIPENEYRLDITSNTCIDDNGLEVPEMDSAYYFTLPVAKRMIFKYQRIFLDKIEEVFNSEMLVGENTADSDIKMQEMLPDDFIRTVSWMASKDQSGRFPLNNLTNNLLYASDDEKAKLRLLVLFKDGIPGAVAVIGSKSRITISL